MPLTMAEEHKVVAPRFLGERIVVDERWEPAGPGRRHRCPFYGMVASERMGLAIGNPGSNACALTLAQAPCRMELEDEAPHWDGCVHFNDPDRSPLLDRVVGGFGFLPTISSSECYDGPRWFEIVMGRPWELPA